MATAMSLFELALPGSVRERADAFWTGAVSTRDVHPVKLATWPIEELVPGLAVVVGFANVTVMRTSAGLVAVDCGSLVTGEEIFDQVRSLWPDERMHTIFYTHGHVDHCFGSLAFDAEAADKGVPLPRVVAHSACAARFDRYKATTGYNGRINMRQFQLDAPRFPSHFRYPDLTIDARRTEMVVGATRLVVCHDRGETDDGLWVWIPEHRTVCTGDLFIWALPNCGNPQKAQRYCAEWVRALRRMSDCEAEILIPGHGPPIFGATRVAQALSDTAALLDSLYAQTVALMNDGATLTQILHTVRVPTELAARPYLLPVYDEAEFVVRGVWRLLGGAYSGEPASLKPPSADGLAREVVACAGCGGTVGGALAARRFAARALELVSQAGDLHALARSTSALPDRLRVAGALADLASRAEPRDEFVRDAHARVFTALASASPSLMAKGVYAHAARQPDELPQSKL